MLAGSCGCSAGLVGSAPFCVPVRLTMIWRLTVMLLRPAWILTIPPVVPVGENVAVSEGPMGMDPILPRSRAQPALIGWPLSRAVYVTVGIFWPMATLIVWSAL